MEITFDCPECGQLLMVEDQDRGCEFTCPACSGTVLVPDDSGADAETAPALPQPDVTEHIPPSEANGSAGDPPVVCPVCWMESDRGDMMHIAVHDSLRGDSVLGEDAQQRFSATRFNNLGQALDALGLACSDIACPHCRRKLPAGFLDVPQHIISLVGDARAGKSYYLSVLAKMLPMSLFKHFNVTFQDADPTGNAALNDMKKTLFSAQSPAQAKLVKTQLEGAMYERLPRQGRIVALPKPFVYTLGGNASAHNHCSVTFYDNAGEHFQPGINLVESPGAQHVAAAAGILYLFDPFNNPELRRRILDRPDPQFETLVNDQQDVILAEMRSRIQSLRHLRLGQRVETPLALLVGKCDVWMHLLGENPFQNPLRDGWLDADAIADNSHRVRELMVGTCPSVVANAEALSSRVTFFPVSAFGHAPVKVGPGDYVPDPSRLRPILAEVPVLWILSGVCPGLIPLRSMAPAVPGN